jgi:hypothetical protein
MSEVVDQLAVANYRCDYCDAAPGHWCRTKSGKHASWLHSARTWALHQAWSAGYVESEKYIHEDRARRADLLRSRMQQHGVDEQAIDEILGAVMSRRYV